MSHVFKNPHFFSRTDTNLQLDNPDLGQDREEPSGDESAEASNSEFEMDGDAADADDMSL